MQRWVTDAAVVSQLSRPWASSQAFVVVDNRGWVGQLQNLILERKNEKNVSARQLPEKKKTEEITGHLGNKVNWNMISGQNRCESQCCFCRMFLSF
jgi:hypothetical protein